MQHEPSLTTSFKKWHGYIRGNKLTMIMLLLAILAVGTLHQPPGVRAAGGPIIHWDSHMIYAGQNNDYPEGPVGEIATVQGANFPPDIQLRLVLAQGDSNHTPAICRLPVATVNTATTDGSGQFNQSFSWPIAAGQVNQEYSICALQAASGNVISHQDDGPFTVLSSSPPIITISTATVTAGNTVIITGQSWVPPQQVNVVIAPCADCGVPATTSGTINSTGLNSGSFSITLTIPAGARPGNYVVNALTSSGLDANHISDARNLTVNGLAPVTTPTTSPTTTPSPTVTATTTVTTTATVTVTTTPLGTNTNASNNSDNTGSSGLIIGLIVSSILVLLAIAAVILFMYRQRSSKKRASPGMPGISTQNYGQPPLPPGAPSPNYVYPVPQQNYGIPPGTSSPNYNASTPQSNYGIPSNNFSDIPTQFMQQNGSLPGYGQSMPPAGYAQPAGIPALLCRNCGRPLSPGDTRCAGCGMPVGTRNPNAPV